MVMTQSLNAEISTNTKKHSMDQLRQTPLGISETAK